MQFKDFVPPILSRKASEVTRIVVNMFNGQAAFTPVKFESLAKEGFQQNVWVYRCIMAIAQAVAGVDWNLYQQKGKNQKEIEDHAILDLLYKPNPFESKQEFFEKMVAYMLLAGNSYLEKVGPNVGPPLELYALRPDRMKVVPHPIDFVGGYEYRVGANMKPFEAAKIMHLKMFSALDDYYGLSPISVAAKGIDNDNAAAVWNNALLNNGARPSGAMVTKEFLQDAQYDRLKNEVAVNYTGASKAGKFMLLEGGLDWKEMGMSPKDMDFIQSKKLSRVEICAAFGVPPEIVGDKEHATYSNYQEARQAFYQDTVLPKLDLIRDKLNAGLVAMYGDNLYLNYDRDGIEALQESRQLVWSRALDAFKAGLLMKNETRDAIGYETVDGGDVFFEPTNIIPTGPDAPEPKEVEEPAKPAAEPAKEEEEEEEKNFFFRDLKLFNMTTEDQKGIFWKAMDRRRTGYYKSGTAKVQGYFKAEQTAVLSAYAAGGAKAINKAIDKNGARLKKILAAIDTTVINDFGTATFNQLKSDAAQMEIKAEEDAFTVFDLAVQQWILENAAEKVVQVTDTTKALINKIIEEGEAAGESVEEVGQKIEQLYLAQIIPNRSVVIARTEIISASNAGNRFAALQTGLKLKKEWISTRDDRTRGQNKGDKANHYDIDGEKAEMDKPYKNGLMFPGDPKGPPHEVIQCRCTEGYTVKK